MLIPFCLVSGISGQLFYGLEAGVEISPDLRSRRCPCTEPYPLRLNVCAVNVGISIDGVSTQGCFDVDTLPALLPRLSAVASCHPLLYTPSMSRQSEFGEVVQAFHVKRVQPILSRN